MKISTILLFILIIAGFTACNDDEEDFFPAEIGQVIDDLTASFDTLNAALNAGAVLIGADVSDTTRIRSDLHDLYNHSTFSENFSFINDQKILQIIEPSEFYPYQGSDVSGQEHINMMFQTREPVLSDVFYAVEGYYAAVDVHPVISGEFLRGGISTLFQPEQILGRIILPYVTGQSFEMWVMQKGGLVLYDQDEEEIGLNVITDPLYQDFPELIAAAELIDSVKAGETTYSFYQTGTSDKVVKKTFWDTFYLYGNEWKIVWVKPE